MPLDLNDPLLVHRVGSPVLVEASQPPLSYSFRAVKIP